MKKQAGFAAVEGVIIVVIVAALIVVGYFVAHKKSTSTAKVATTDSSYLSPPVTTQAAPQITNANDLKTALQVMDSTSVSSNNADSAQLTTQSQSF